MLDKGLRAGLKSGDFDRMLRLINVSVRCTCRDEAKRCKRLSYQMLIVLQVVDVVEGTWLAVVMFPSETKHRRNDSENPRRRDSNHSSWKYP